MSDHLTRSIKRYIETTPNESALAITRRCNLPRSALDNIFRRHLPEPKRLKQLLGAVDDLTACEWLEAYLRDHTPDIWQGRTQIRVEALDKVIVREAVGRPAATVQDRFAEASAWLQKRSQGDDELAEWFINTIDLLRGLHANLETSMENTDAAMSLALGKPYSTAEPEEPGQPGDSAKPFTPDETALLAAAERQAAADSLGGTPGKPTPARKP